MVHKEEITKAIGAHGMWKTRLTQAIETGKMDATADTVRMDNQCAFGKWLYGASLDAKDKTSSYYEEVKNLHAKFHQTAAQVVELALVGKKREAQQLMSLEGEYTEVSARLTASMSAWVKKLAA
ncbi:MAG: CZB domain-containing protein [Nitrospirae bacterium]|nr:CZB domain-containing protein [Nitrospirota bacterium]